MLQPVVRLLRSASFARAVLVYLALLCGVAAWLPWVRGAAREPAPAWARATGFDAPFSSWPFLVGCAALFASTFACTWGKRARVARLWRGELPAGAVELPRGPGADASAFLAARGFRGAGPVRFRFRAALWGGWVLHVGLLVLIAAVTLQQALHDEGAFELAPGETVRLADAGAVFGRSRGPLAPREPPGVTASLAAFDAFLHQPGYAPDRASRLVVRAEDGEERAAEIDRAAGIEIAGVEIYQAIPSGLALAIEVDGVRAVVHLRAAGPRRASAEVTDPAGRPARFVVEAERALDDRLGTGPLAARLESAGEAAALAPGRPFAFGGRAARLDGFTRWAGFTYARRPGMALVALGFALVLGGAALLAFPAGVARLDEPGAAARVHLARGAEAIDAEWREACAAPRASDRECGTTPAGS